MRKAVDDLAAGASRPRPQTGERGPRARTVRPDEPLIDWTHWPIERVWHALRGTQPWLDALEHPRYATVDWSVLEFTRGPSSGEPGTVREDGEGYFAAHPQGKIRLSLDRSWRARARRALRSV
jgi:methionyl-tRNA formyltransferase